MGFMSTNAPKSPERQDHHLMRIVKVAQTQMREIKELIQQGALPAQSQEGTASALRTPRTGRRYKSMLGIGELIQLGDSPAQSQGDRASALRSPDRESRSSNSPPMLGNKELIARGPYTAQSQEGKASAVLSPGPEEKDRSNSVV